MAERADHHPVTDVTSQVTGAVPGTFSALFIIVP